MSGPRTFIGSFVQSNVVAENEWEEGWRDLLNVYQTAPDKLSFYLSLSYSMLCDLRDSLYLDYSLSFKDFWRHNVPEHNLKDLNDNINSSYLVMLLNYLKIVHFIAHDVERTTATTTTNNNNEFDYAKTMATLIRVQKRTLSFRDAFESCALPRKSDPTPFYPCFPLRIRHPEWVKTSHAIWLWFHLTAAYLVTSTANTARDEIDRLRNLFITLDVFILCEICKQHYQSKKKTFENILFSSNVGDGEDIDSRLITIHRIVRTTQDKSTKLQKEWDSKDGERRFRNEYREWWAKPF